MIPGLFTGAGLSLAAPASLPSGPVFHRRIYEACFAGAERVAPGLLPPGLVDTLCAGHRNLLARLETTAPGASAGTLACLHVEVPNEAHLLAALHLAHGGRHVTVNCDNGIERAYALVTGADELPDGTAACHRDLLAAWRDCVPSSPPPLAVVRDAVDFEAGGFDRRPLLVRLHGGIGGGVDGIVHPTAAGRDEPDVLDLGHRRCAALDALVADTFVIVTGFSGSDLASCAALLERLRPGRFAWVAPTIAGELRRELRALDPNQPVTGRAVAALRASLPVDPPPWPATPAAVAGFDERFAAWSATLPPHAAAEALAWVLRDVGRHAEADALSPAAPQRRARSPRTGPGFVLSLIEARRALALRSAPGRWVATGAARLGAASARRALARGGAAPSGRQRVLLRAQAIELAAIAAALSGRSAPPDALRAADHALRAHEHLGDVDGVVEATCARALVHLAGGAHAEALADYQAACRLHPAPTGPLASMTALLERHPRDERTFVLPDARLTARGTSALEAYVRALPKVELHVHLEGSIAPARLAVLARRARDHRVPWSAEGVARWYRYSGYTDFLNAYVLVCDQLRTAEDFVDVAIDLGARLARENVRYAEVTVSPVAHVRRGIRPEDLFAGLEHGRREVESVYGVRLRWCAACGTRRGARAALDTVEMVLAQRPAGVISIGLAGHESDASRASFAPAFSLAAATGLHRVVHAGEAAGAAAITEAIDVLGAERIGHGIRCLDDPAVVERLRRSGVPLEVCPTSNVRTGVVRSLRTHPLPRLLAEGLDVTLGTDDPAMFHVDLGDEYLRAARAFGLQADAVAELARCGVRSAFLDDQTAQALMDELDAVPVPDELALA
jgi:aminodeoxyfutalosine deaminase